MDFISLFKGLLEASWQGSVAILLILALRPLLSGRIPARWFSFLWLLVLLRLLIPGSLLPHSPASLQNYAGASQSVTRATLFFEQIQGSDSASRAFSTMDTGRASSPLSPSARELNGSWNGWHLAILAWLAGAFTIAAWFTGAALRLHRRIARDFMEANVRITAIWNRCCDKLELRSRPRLRVSSAISSPALAGVFRPTVLLPRGTCDQLTDEDCEHILLHELAHYRSRDHWTQLLQLAALCIHWFNPFVWLGCNYLRVDRELAADEGALQQLPDTRLSGYGHTLMRLLTLPAPADFASAGIGILENTGQLKHRLRRIVAFRPLPLARSFLGLVLVGAGAAAVLTAAETVTSPGAGWSVTSMVIPHGGDIQQAEVKLKTPTGRIATLHVGTRCDEGFWLQSITQEKAAEKTSLVFSHPAKPAMELTADPQLISSSTEPLAASLPIEVRCYVLRLTAETAARAADAAKGKIEVEEPFVDHLDWWDSSSRFRASGSLGAIPGARADFQNMRQKKGADKVFAVIDPSVNEAAPKPGQGGVVGPGEYHKLLQALAAGGLNLVSRPTLWVASGRRAMVASTPPPASEEEGKPAAPAPPDNDIILVEALPTFTESGGIYLDAQVTLPPPSAKQSASKDALNRLPAAPGPEKREARYAGMIKPNEIVILDLGKELDADAPNTETHLLVYITASAKQQGPVTVFQPPPLPPSATSVGKPVPGRPGYITSPYAPDAGFIDVKEYPAGTEIKDPYSGKILLVP